jgi:hypothetical protein
LSPFDWLKQITVEKKPWDTFSDEDKDGFNAFIINKALSYNQYYIPIVEMAMTYPMPNDKLYDFYKDAIPKKQVWNKWIKSNVKWDEDEINALAQYFECGTKDVKDFYSLLDVPTKDIILKEINGFEGKPKKKRKSKKK